MTNLTTLHKAAKKKGYYKKTVIVLASLALLATSVLPFLV